MRELLENIPVLEAIIGLVAMLAGIGVSLSTRRKTHNDAAESISRAAKNIVDANTVEMERLRVEDVLHESYINYLLGGIIKLQRQLRRHGLRPVFSPLPIRVYIEKESPR